MKPEAYAELSLQTSGAVLRVTLDRPRRRNALSARMVAELIEVIEAAERDHDISVLVLRGAGAGFCSGYDVSSAGEAQAQPSPVENAQRARRDNRLFDTVRRCPIPTIAQVHGPCLAAGADLAMSCDLIACATDARIGYPAVRSMGTPATHMWLYYLGAQWTKRLLLTGDSITGAKAAELGLALTAVEPGALDDHVDELAARIAQVPRDLLVANKYVVDRGLDLMGRELLQDEAARQEALARTSPDTQAFWTAAAQRGVKRAVAERDGPFSPGDPIG